MGSKKHYKDVGKTKDFEIIVDRDRGLYPKAAPDLSDFTEEITEEDERIFERITTTNLTEEQIDTVTTVQDVYSRERQVLGLHWHPEYIPMELILERVGKMFPNREEELLIPTQHNVFLTNAGFAGAEIDCFSKEFNTKVQLLIHLRADRLEEAHTLKSMAQHTFSYRLGQLDDFIETILNPAFDERIIQAAAETNADEEMVRFLAIHTSKIKRLIDKHEARIEPMMLRNKLLREYFDRLRGTIDTNYIDRVQVLLKAIKKIVKSHFNFEYFYEAAEIIEEARANGACIVIPHPEQFWPILLAGYDVDGIEVWNPQSQAYTDFLINAVQRLNRAYPHKSRPLLITMGDDCHLGEKVKPVERQDKAKAAREVGLQPAWNDLAIKKALGRHSLTKSEVMRAYRARLEG